MAEVSKQEEAGEDEELAGPPPPGRGSAAYRRLLVEISASEDYDTFHHRMTAPWQYVGWRIGVDVMIEILYHVSVSVIVTDKNRDAFGNIKLVELFRTLDEEERLLYATRIANREFKHMRPHEAFKKAHAEGEDFAKKTSELIPALQLALNAIESQGREAAWPILVKHLSREGDRAGATSYAISIVHAALRQTAMPPGDGWVDQYFRSDMFIRAGVQGSTAYYTTLDPGARVQEMEWWSPPKKPKGPPSKRKRVPDARPKCTCARHRPAGK